MGILSHRELLLSTLLYICKCPNGLNFFSILLATGLRLDYSILRTAEARHSLPAATHIGYLSSTTKEKGGKGSEAGPPRRQLVIPSPPARHAQAAQASHTRPRSGAPVGSATALGASS